MAKFRLKLNYGFNNNYSFFDPTTMVNLTISNPIGFADRVTPHILRGLKYKTILDIDNAIDLEKGILREVPLQAPVNDGEIKTDADVKEEVVGDKVEQPVESAEVVPEVVTEVVEEEVQENQEVITGEVGNEVIAEETVQANNVEEKKANKRKK